jgi:hypothetical protein
MHEGKCNPNNGLLLLTYHSMYVDPGGTDKVIAAIPLFIGILPDVEF